ncbi:probable aspartyl protease At4g16563 [Macadamia integrifolia]|uniref:probable aspartyl protease At4g16563 n=1 Tax=Macadamia integrifolia TaxID=60698 RepID=UPI001C52CD78|nr:probable aspartyl protease At4g16563 [Macadamia integrifolia]
MLMTFFSSSQKTMASSLSRLLFFSFFSLISLLSSISSLAHDKSTTLTLSLTQFNKNPSADPWERLTHLASASLIRARHLKSPQSSVLSKTPLFPHSYGGYSISLSFGTPSQTVPFVMDTGSDLVWFPCTHRYICRNCSFANQNPSSIQTFIPKLSSSTRIVGCQNPKCSWLHSSDVQSRCSGCESNSRNCSQICPPYIITYGSGSTGGILLSETLDFPKRKVPDFIVGCSVFSTRQPSGIAGFGRGPSSIPSQLHLKKFSYCLLSHRLDDTSQSSSLILTDNSDSGNNKTGGVSYTPFVKNPVTGRPAFSVYYYLGLRQITVGGKKVKIPYNSLSLGSDGNGGTIIDSGSTFTFMEKRVFDLVAQEFETQVKSYKRALNMEALTGLRPCFDISAAKDVSLPELVFHFKGGAKMALPLANYYSIFGNTGIVCMTLVTDGIEGPEISGGPSIILGNYQQQNFYVEYDLEKQRLGFRQQSCGGE